MHCPVCNQPLLVVERDLVEVDYCIECHGIWFDEGEIEVLGERAGVTIEITALTQAPPSASSERYLRCPRCEKKMRKADLYRGDRVLIVDFCPAQHGIWFDRGETAHMISTAVPTAEQGADLITEFLGETFVSGREVTEGA